nr:NADH dehydrogenase subunit 6 [Xyloredo sp. E88]UPX89030.1 NADH dehydrogenase subunit 6 [Xyloredo sp. E89]
MSFLFLIIFVSWNLFFFMGSPLGLIGGLLVLSILSVLLISMGLSFIVGFCLFMCMISGVLVLVSYCVALIPFSGAANFDDKMFLLSSLKFGWKFLLYSLIFFLFISFLFFFYEDYSVFCFVRSVESFICTEDWLGVMVLLSFYLFLTIIVCVNICSKYSGALIGENWFLES